MPRVQPRIAVAAGSLVWCVGVAWLLATLMAEPSAHAAKHALLDIEGNLVLVDEV
jgi:hypothetical protein